MKVSSAFLTPKKTQRCLHIKKNIRLLFIRLFITKFLQQLTLICQIAIRQSIFGIACGKIHLINFEDVRLSHYDKSQAMFFLHL